MASRCHNSAVVGAILQCAYEELGVSAQSLCPISDLQSLTDRARVSHDKWSDRAIHNVENERNRLGEWYNKVRVDLEPYAGDTLPHILINTPGHVDIPNIRKAMAALAGRLKKIPTFMTCDELPAETQHFVHENLKKHFKNFGYKPNYVYLLNDVIAGYIFIGATDYGNTMVFTCKTEKVDHVTEYYIHRFMNNELEKHREGSRKLEG